MSFEAYLKHWLGNPINEATSQNTDSLKFEEIRNTIDNGIGGDLSDPIAKTTSFESIEKVLAQLDPIILQKIKSNPDLQKVLLAMLSPGKISWLNEYVTKSKKSLSSIHLDKKKVDPTASFDKFTRLTIKEADIKSKIYKLYLIFKYGESIPDLDNDTNILLYIKNEGISLISSVDENSPKYKIGKIGRIDNLVQSNEFEVIEDSGESKILQKEELKNLLELNPQVAEKAKESTTVAYRKKLSSATQKVENTIRKEVADAISYNAEVINNLPNNESTMERLQVDWKPLIDALGYSKFYNDAIKKKEEKIIATEKPSLRRKNRIREKLMTALKLSLLPPLTNGKISQPGGDYFKLMKKLEESNTAWLEASIKEVLVSSERISQFNNSPRKEESSLEEDQLAYLHISSNWISKYVQSEVDGELSKRDLDNALSRIKTITQEKEKEIKNYYLSKDFNMSNFKGLQLKPDLRLPLYQRIKLAVSESDRIAESPLKNLLKGLGQVAIGLLSAVPVNNNQEVAERNANRNRAIFNGLFSIIKGGTYAVSKQAGRSLEKKVSNITNKARLDAFGLTPYEKTEAQPNFYKTAEKKTNEQDTSGISPGTSMQVPGTLPADNMDTFALAGPGNKIKNTKKTNITSKKKKPKSLITKISSFKDFLKD